ncbi:MAG: type II toxin-antitoxin system VapC family toxin [Pyrobaculum sp.]
MSIATDLIYYELGNFLRRVGKADLLEEFKNSLRLVTVESVGLNGEVLKLALDERIFYYDAVYLHLCRKYGAALVGDDSDLVAKGAPQPTPSPSGEQNPGAGRWRIQQGGDFQPLR